MLDEEFKRRVKRLSVHLEEPLSEAARDRIVETVLEQGPRAFREVERRQRWTRIGVPVLAAAAAVALLVTKWSEERPATGSVVAALPGERPCAARPVPASLKKGFATDGVTSKLSLGPAGVAALVDDARARVSEATPCKTVFSLEAGRIVVYAADLGGGELVVRAGETDITVRGTLFSVSREPGSIAVEVVEGVVVVRHEGEEYEVEAGRRWMASNVGVAAGRLSLEAASWVDAVGRPRITALDTLPSTGFDALSELSVPELPATGATPRREGVAKTEAPSQTPERVALTETAPGGESAQDLMRQAESRRRAGAYAEARQLYQKAGEGTGPTAEAAWVALARMELALGNPQGARAATARRQQRFGNGALSPEAGWIDVRAYQAAGDDAGARRAAEQLVERWPGSPQSAAARRLLGR